ncbi:protein kinase domain-containing protein [Micromonospora fluostatini]|uniref:protein kinase domain-containing protein n=1 Tax=Micromonospora sp. JCM 30529 TaxID=3421643 RepID=UPI003D17775A
MQVLGGRYQLVEPVGEGGMAVVWRATDRVLRRTVAVKLLASRLATEERFRARVRQEAYAAAQLNHPHIAGVYDYGETRHGRQRKVPYLVLEFVDGGTLAERLRGTGALDWPETVRVGADVAAALAAAHAAGLVHRDVKPANVMLSPAGVKVVDLGIAESVGQPTDLGTGEVLGTPRYMAPEQARGEAAVPASDLYALGLLLIECLTGRPPAHGSTPTELIRQRQKGIGPAVPDVPGLPEAVTELCRRCLAPDPADRPSAVAAAEILARVAGPRPLTTPGTPPDLVPVPVPVPTSTPGPAALTETGPLTGTGALADTGPDRRGTRAGEGSSRRGADERRRRRPLLLAAAPAAVLVAVLGTQLPGVGTADDSGDGVRADAAPVAPVPGCAARYVARHDLDGTFVAEVVVTNSGTAVLPSWQLGFTLPAGQRLVGSPDDVEVRQQGQGITVRAGQALTPGGTTTLSVRGTHDVTGAEAPGEFTLNGTRCDQAFATVTSASGPTSVPSTGGTGGIGAADGEPSAAPTPTPTGEERPGRPLPIPSEVPSPGTGGETPDPEPTSPSPSPSIGTPSPEPSGTPSPEPTGPSEPPSPGEDDDTGASPPASTPAPSADR